LNLDAIAIAAAAILSIAAIAPDAGAQTRQEQHVTAEQAIACIKTATSNGQGRVKDLEIDVKDGKTVCDVEVIDVNGKKAEVRVDIGTNKIIRVKH
jgi:uncharacterized membrane protein YkoI